MAATLSTVLACTNGGLKTDIAEGRAPANEVRIVLKAEPLGLNPILSVQSISRYLTEQIFQTLNSQDPQTFELRPGLASLPETVRLPDGGLSYHYEIDSAATWPNGKPVLASDVVFSLKVLLNPLVEAGPFRPYYSMIRDVAVDPEDPRSFDVITRGPYLLAAQAIGDLYVYPEYAYDPEGLLRDVPLDELSDPERADELVKEIKELRQFAERFNDPAVGYEPDRVVGSGPYELVSWEPGDRLRLRRRDNYWARDRSEEWLAAYPQNLTFLIIPDNTTTANALRDHLVDVVVDMPIEQYQDLRDEEYLQQYYDFVTVPSFKYYSILLNQADPLLRDSLTRRALAHLVDVDQIITQLLPGLAERIIGPVLPAKDYYNRELPAIAYDVEKARDLLRRAGWRDTNDNHILDKVIDGERRELSFELLSTPSPTSEAVALEIAQSARAVGVDIRVMRQEPRTLLQELTTGNFTASFYGQGFEPTPDDFSQVWSSTSVPPSGTNRANFQNAEADSLIVRIARTIDPQSRAPLYRRFQEIIYDNQPMIFLYSPFDRLVVSKRLEYAPTSLAPNVNFNTLRIRPTGTGGEAQ
ncbi:ABC transporter substrate-binding protein [Neolewinella litorea]|nr:ABC transporter substrate-binding protein [Neolewinella litorea]